MADTEPITRSEEELPLIAGKVHGLRSWSIEFDAGRASLSGPYSDVNWERGGAPTKAVCTDGHWPHAHDPPGKWCNCGLYALHPNPESAVQLMQGSNEGVWPAEICGVVEAWGRVEVHESGFRAEFARPYALCVRRAVVGTDWGNLVERLARSHGAEVIVVDSPDDLLEQCRARNLGLSEDAVSELLRGEEERVPTATDLPSGSPGAPTRVGDGDKKRSVGDLASRAVGAGAAALGALFSLLFWGALGLGVLGLILGWFSDDSPSAAARARDHLRIVDQAVLGAGGSNPVYVAVVHNGDSRRAALGVAPRLRLANGGQIGRLASSGTFEQPANVPPGGSAVAVDRIRAVPTARLGPPALGVKAFRRIAPFPVKRIRVRGADARCRLRAELATRRPIDRLKLIALARRDGQIAGGMPFHISDVPRGQSERELPRLPSGLCHMGTVRWSVYPALRLERNRWAS